MRIKMITFVFFVAIISMFFPFFMSQIQSQTNTPYRLVSSESPPPLIAKEKEVNQFFDNYEALYKRKDINRFLSLFSSKAVQNRKDRIDKIRRTYTDFFNQSEELRCQIKRKIEIYQNAVDVKGFYEIDQLNKSGKKKVWSGSIHLVLTKEDGVLKIISIDFQPKKS